VSAPRTTSLDGLDLDTRDTTTPEEWEAYRESQRAALGRVLPTFELFGEFRPDVVKRFLRQSGAVDEPGSFGTQLRYLHYYAFLGHTEGVLYQLGMVERNGHTRGEVLDTLALVTLHSPNFGLHYMGPKVADALRRYRAREEPFGWPDGWRHDPAELASGLDFSAPDLRPGELELLEAWYDRVTGEVPRHVRFLAVHRPALLKAYRDRFENTLRELPNQMLPFLLLHFETIRGHEDGIREAALLGRGLGMTKKQALSAVASAMNYAGPAGISNVDRAAGDVFAGW
jgi:hypothetical protein